MTKNPFYNALGAALYVLLVVSAITGIGKLFSETTEDNFLMPVSMLSLFVISAAIMGYIVLYHPLQLFLDNKRGEAVQLFLRTIGIFAAITVVIFATSILIGYKG